MFVFLLQQADPTITVRYGLVPLFVENGQYERLITSAFLHANFLHLATNMLTLYIVGAPLERVLRTGRYLTVYLLSALGGSLLSLWLSPAFSNGVGASGAIFGLFGALVVLRRQVGAQAGGLVMLIGLNLVISFTVPNISWQAHIGGLVTGTLVAVVFDTVTGSGPPPRHLSRPAGARRRGRLPECEVTGTAGRYARPDTGTGVCNGAAGLLLRDRHDGVDRVVLQHRAWWSHQGGTWGIPGGARDSDETAVAAALRESAEEANPGPRPSARTGS